MSTSRTPYITIEKEKEEDRAGVFDLIENAFSAVEISDHREQFLVERLRTSGSFNPELSLIARHRRKIVGYVLLSPVQIVNKSQSFDALALAPVAVDPGFQGKGIGGRLILAAHKAALMNGYSAIILIGHASYYPRFGYKKAEDFGINVPFEVPSENVMLIELDEGSLKGISGTVSYPKAFFES